MFETEVAAGMAFMDARDVPGWKSLIDLDKLDLASFDSCVVGQRFKEQAMPLDGFSWAMDEFELSNADMVRLGFDIGPTGHFGQLTTAWIEALKPFRKVVA